jgi:hypothetical protein
MRGRASFVAVAALVALVAACRTEHDPAPGPSSPTAATNAIPSAAPSAHVGTPPVSTCHPPPPAATARLVLERTVCYGTCPDYTVEVHPDGTVLYEGRQFVRVRGKVRGTMAKPVADALFAQAACAGSSGWKADYTFPITDNPTANVTVDLGTGKTIVVRDYPPCHGGQPGDPDTTPAALCQLEQAIDTSANTSVWTECRAADGGPDYCGR